ncbi:MAG: hypothetical protein LBV04_09505 [Deferribacteraceae bacterium]|jgi:hypothetical protein|nr:hypothetical protein [Deferribacteraceae bacterium]
MKFVKILLCTGLAAIALSVATPNAHALDAGLTGGVFIPSGDAADLYDYELGYALKAHVGSDSVIPMVEWRAFAGYYQASIDEELNNGSSLGDLQSTNGGLMLVFSPPTPIVTAYVGVGYALHKTSYGVNGSAWGHGMIAELGVGMSFVIAEIGLYANYMDNSVKDDNFDENLKLGGISAGLFATVGF